jgi:hypothetical protein
MFGFASTLLATWESIAVYVYSERPPQSHLASLLIPFFQIPRRLSHQWRHCRSLLELRYSGSRLRFRVREHS